MDFILVLIVSVTHNYYIVENYNDVILAQISNARKKSNRPVFGMAQINAMKQDMVLAGLSESYSILRHHRQPERQLVEHLLVPPLHPL